LNYFAHSINRALTHPCCTAFGDPYKTTSPSVAVFHINSILW